MLFTSHFNEAILAKQVDGPENAIKFLRCRTAAFAVFATALIVNCGGSSSETSNDTSELANSSEIGELVIDEDAAGAPSGDGTLSIPSTSESLDVSSDLDSEEEDTATADELTDEERALLFAECMRDEGIENWPDPATNPDGSVDLSGGGAVGLGPSSAVTLQSDEVRAAIPVCGPLIAGASFLPNNGQGISTEAQDQLVNFAQCLRDEGIDVSDPDLSGGATGLLSWDFDPGDPANADAMEACQTLFAGGSGG